MSDNGMDKICSGCLLYERHKDDDEYKKCIGYKQNHIDCPCLNCLVKMICVEVCDDYREKWEVFKNAGL